MISYTLYAICAKLHRKSKQCYVDRLKTMLKNNVIKHFEDKSMTCSISYVNWKVFLRKIIVAFRCSHDETTFGKLYSWMLEEHNCLIGESGVS